MTYDAIIIGGGAAGLFCAITAGRRAKGSRDRTQRRGRA
ncbi:MAG: NAD(P)/FAD-dependent oxidoreductase [Acidobacteria bacterium]|nr:NAD(P)/FAD-dependent oxidoreductase [Acidobacteriota bacterium]